MRWADAGRAPGSVARGGLAMGGVVGGLGLAVMPVAEAHDWLVSSNPSANASVTRAPADVKLTFNEPVLTKPAAPRVAVVGPGGRHYETGCPAALDATVKVPWTAGAPGRYTVEWRVISADGHPVSDSLSFTYAGGSGPNKGADAAPKCATTHDDSSGRGASAASGASAGEGRGPSSSSSGDSTPIYVAGGAALAAVAAIGALVVSARRRPRGAGVEGAHVHEDDDDRS